MTTTQAKALRSIATIILEAISAADPVIGAPGGHLYMGLMHAGCTLDQFQQLMGSLVRLKFVKQTGECYHITDLGRDFLRGGQ
jgi:predicted transcriptional regulator